MASLEQLPVTFIDTIIIPVKSYRFIGLDFFEDGKSNFKNYFKFMMFFILAFVFCFGLIYFYIKINEIDAGILETSNVMCTSCLMIQCASKISLIKKKHLIRSVVYGLAELWPGESQDLEKKIIIDSWLHRIKIISDFVFKFSIFGLTVFNGVAVFIYSVKRYSDENAAYVLAFHQHFPFEINSLWKYLLICLMQCLASTVLYECCYLACDMFLFTLTFDVSLLLRLLQVDLRNMTVERSGPGMEEAIDNLKNVVKRHQKILKLADTLNEIFSNIMFTLLMFSSLIMCFYGFLFIVISDKFQKFVYITAALEILFAVFYIMLPGQILINTSSGVADAAYDTLWYNGDERFKKMIFIIIAR
uniref:Odorant receptor n=1 Tax=Grapholita molesta TaxID=192188 RepID=A0A9Y1N8F2_GRAMO|nr:odorant-receptor-41 [Grapholita molesta]